MQMFVWSYKVCAFRILPVCPLKCLFFHKQSLRTPLSLPLSNLALVQFCQSEGKPLPWFPSAFLAWEQGRVGGVCSPVRTAAGGLVAEVSLLLGFTASHIPLTAPVGTHTQLLSALFHSLACAPDDLVGLIILCVPASLQILPLLCLSASTLFPPSPYHILLCILVCRFIFLHYSVFFLSFSISFKSKGYCRHWGVKKCPSCHFSDLEWEQETTFSLLEPYSHFKHKGKGRFH